MTILSVKKVELFEKWLKLNTLDSVYQYGPHDNVDHMVLNKLEFLVPYGYKKYGFIPPTIYGEVWAETHEIIVKGYSVKDGLFRFYDGLKLYSEYYPENSELRLEVDVGYVEKWVKTCHRFWQETPLSVAEIYTQKAD